jgi:hypothetical protein
MTEPDGVGDISGIALIVGVTLPSGDGLGDEASVGVEVRRSVAVSLGVGDAVLDAGDAVAVPSSTGV